MNVGELMTFLSAYEAEMPIVNEMDEPLQSAEENSDPTPAIVLVF